MADLFRQFINDILGVNYDFIDAVDGLLESDYSEFIVVDGEEGDHGDITYRFANEVVCVRHVHGGDCEDIDLTEFGKKWFTEHLIKMVAESLSIKSDGVKHLVVQVEEMVKQSGIPDCFDAAKWTEEWLQRPLPALGGKRPDEFMDTFAGRDLVSNLLAQSQSGSYA